MKYDLTKIPVEFLRYRRKDDPDVILEVTANQEEIFADHDAIIVKYIDNNNDFTNSIAVEDKIRFGTLHIDGRYHKGDDHDFDVIIDKAAYEMWKLLTEI